MTPPMITPAVWRCVESPPPVDVLLLGLGLALAILGWGLLRAWRRP